MSLNATEVTLELLEQLVNEIEYLKERVNKLEGEKSNGKENIEE